MNYFNLWSFLLWIVLILLQQGTALPLNLINRLSRIKRTDPSPNAFEAPVPEFPSREDAQFLIPAPYPLPTTELPPPRPVRPPSRYFDSINPYLDALTDSYYPNYGFGLLYQQPVVVSGGLNWPTGNVLQPTDKFNGTLGFVRPVQLRFGTQGGPFYPWQDARFTQTIKQINEANYLAQLQNYYKTLNDASLGNPYVITAPNNGGQEWRARGAQNRVVQQRPSYGSGANFYSRLIPRFR